MGLKRLLYQTHVKLDDSNYYNYSSLTCQSYCEKYNIDYKFDLIDKDRYHPYMFNSMYFEKYKAINFLNTYDQVLYIDSDVLIKTNSNNIFDQYKDLGFVGILDIISLKHEIFLKQNYIAPNKGKINSGVLLFNNKVNDLPLKLYLIDILFANEHYIGTPAQQYILEQFSLGKWYQFWEQKHKNQLTYNRYGNIIDEDLFDYVINTYKVAPFHIGLKYNAFRNLLSFDQVKNDDDINFVHYNNNKYKMLIESEYNKVWVDGESK